MVSASLLKMIEPFSSTMMVTARPITPISSFFGFAAVALRSSREESGRILWRYDVWDVGVRCGHAAHSR